jgi:hypothetical protein
MIPCEITDEFISTYSKCSKFGERSLITGEITYEYTSICRGYENKCGKEAKYYIEEPNLDKKITKFKLKKKFKNMDMLITSFTCIGIWLNIFYIVTKYL